MGETRRRNGGNRGAEDGGAPGRRAAKGLHRMADAIGGGGRHDGSKQGVLSRAQLHGSCSVSGDPEVFRGGCHVTGGNWFLRCRRRLIRTKFPTVNFLPSSFFLFLPSSSSPSHLHNGFRKALRSPCTFFFPHFICPCCLCSSLLAELTSDRRGVAGTSANRQLLAGQPSHHLHPRRR